MKTIALILLIGITTNPTSVLTRADGGATIVKRTSRKQPITDLVCFFSVRQNGTVVGPVTFSRSLKPNQAKYITEEIMHLSPLPGLPGHDPRKVYFEIAKNGDTSVGFAK